MEGHGYGMKYRGCCGAAPYIPGGPDWGYGVEDNACYDFSLGESGIPKVKCKTTKECVKTYKTCYKMYKISVYRLYKICSRCGFEFDYYGCRGLCPRCR